MGGSGVQGLAAVPDGPGLGGHPVSDPASAVVAPSAVWIADCDVEGAADQGPIPQLPKDVFTVGDGS